MAKTQDCIKALKITEKEAGELALATSDDAAKRAIENQLQSVALKRRQAKLQGVAMKRLGEWLADQPDKEKALESILSARADSGGNVSIERHQQAILGQYHAQLSDMFEKYQVKKLGFGTDQSGPRNMVRELFGHATGDADAAAFAKVWKQVAEMARERFNKAGGDVHKLQTWFLPQTHDPLRVRAVGFDNWYDDVVKLIDKDAVYRSLGIDPSEGELKASLKEVYEFIESDGMKGLDPEKALVNGTSKMANRHQETRLLHFKDGDSWLKYQDSFGQYDTPYTSMNNYLFIMSRETGMMEKMGPNPEHTFNYLRDIARKSTNNRDTGSFAQKVYNGLGGKMYSENTKLAGIFQTIRSAEVALKLGSAQLSALSDTWFMGMAAKYNNIPVLKQFGSFFRGLNPANKIDRQFATRMGFVAEYAMDRAHSTYRYADVTGHGAMQQLADATIRASGLNHWTNAGKTAFQLEFSGMLADQLGTSWKKLNHRMKRMFKKYGVDEADWVRMQGAKLDTHRGGQYFNPMNVDDATGNKITGMILEEMTYAVPEANIRVRTHLNQGLNTGTWAGEAMRSMMQFKTFPVTVMTTHFARGLTQDGAWNKMGYLGSLMVGTTALGMLAYNAKEISKGRTPMTPDNPKLWAEGFRQGDGTGIVGDFLMNDASKFGRSVSQGLLGPAVGDVEDLVFKFLIGSAHDLTNPDKSDLFKSKGSMASYMVKKFTPGQLWYNRLLLERYVFDRLNKEMDPKWHSKQSRAQRVRRKEYGNEYWWKPGKNKPRGM